MRYVLGVRYGATSLALEALGVYLCQSRSYDAVQETAKRVPGLKRDQVLAGVKTPALAGDLTSVKCKGEWLAPGITLDPISGLAVPIDALAAQDSKTLQDWIAPIAKSVGATGVVTADADGSLTAIGVRPQQAATDVTRLGELVKSRQKEQAAELEALHRRYPEAAPPHAGEHFSLASRLRLLFLDGWNLWHRLTRYRTWKGPKGETLAGTTPASERAIGWWIKERSRTMRGDIRP